MRLSLFPTFGKKFYSPGRRKRSKKRFSGLRLLLLILLLIIAFRQVEGFLRQPQAIFVLGGDKQREKFAITFAQEHPGLPIWISSGSNPEYSEWIFTQAGLDPSLLHLNFEAVDTVTNFTTLVDTFKAQGIRSVYLITSDYHMRRAWVIGEIILGSRGIGFRTISVPSGRSPEAIEKVIRDAARSVLWVTTGHTGSSLARFFSDS